MGRLALIQASARGCRCPPSWRIRWHLDLSPLDPPEPPIERARGVQSTTGRASLTPGGIQSKLFDMRTTLDIPEPLLEEARHVLGFKSKTDTVVLALQELVRKRRIEELKSLLGSVSLEIDIPKSRRRP